MKFSIIPVSVVCYDNIEEVKNFAVELSKQSMVDKIVYLVTCNKCEEKFKLKEELEKVGIAYQIYEPRSNLGYLHGCLFGLKTYSETNSYTWAMITNTDISFEEKDFFEKAFVKEIKKENWCIAPNIYRAEDGILQNPFMVSRVSRSRMILYNLIYSNKFFYLAYLRLSLIKKKRAKSSEIRSKKGLVYAVHGSCFFLRKECIDTLIENNDSIFMYGEEILIAEIIRENQKGIYYNEKINVVHHENQTTGKINYGTRQKWFKNSMKYLYKRFYLH